MIKLFAVVFFSCFLFSCADDGPSLLIKKRVPKSALLELLAYLDSSTNKNSYNDDINAIKNMIMTHSLKPYYVEKYLNSIHEKYKNDQKLSDLSSNLLSKLDKSYDYDQLFEDPYGRAFDSFFVWEIVNAPPPEIGKTATIMAKALRKSILKLKEISKPQLSYEVFKTIKEKDPRFWFPKVKQLIEIQKSDQYNKTIDTVLSFLNTKKNKRNTNNSNNVFDFQNWRFI